MYLASVVLLSTFALVCFGQAVVQTDCGPVQGKQITSNLWAFLGIPYALSPVGPLRWKPSIGLAEGKGCWKGTFRAKTFGSNCFQGNPATDNENCLFLNVWTPSLPHFRNGSGLAVMAYIHGGGLTSGSGAIPQLGTFAADMNVVSVSMNYRLNGFGFMALNELSQNDPNQVSGNYGFLDQMLALKWIQSNIANFGGDPNSVTIYGQSSGGTSVLVLVASPLAAGLFHKAISMSGSVFINRTLEEVESINSVYIKSAHCANAQNVTACLYNLTTEEAYQALPFGRYPYWDHPWDFGIPYGNEYDSSLANVDGYVLPVPLSEALAIDAIVNDVPTVFGVMAQEVDAAPFDVVINYTNTEFLKFLQTRFWGADFAQEIVALYPLESFETPQEAYDTIATDVKIYCGNVYNAMQASQGMASPVYLYYSNQWPSQPFPNSNYQPRYAFHGLDFISLLLAYPYDMNDDDLAYASNLRKAFTNFANFGKLPSPWKVVNELQQSGHFITNVVAATTFTSVDWRANFCTFWNQQNYVTTYGWRGQ